MLLYKNGRFQFSRLESLLRQALKSPARASKNTSQQDSKSLRQLRIFSYLDFRVHSKIKLLSRDSRKHVHGANARGLRSLCPCLRESDSECFVGGKPIELLLGSEGGFVRSLVTDELAKGIDAAWRLATDNALQDVRLRLSSVLQVAFT